MLLRNSLNEKSKKLWDNRNVEKCYKEISEELTKGHWKLYVKSTFRTGIGGLEKMEGE